MVKVVVFQLDVKCVIIFDVVIEYMEDYGYFDDYLVVDFMNNDLYLVYQKKIDILK